MKPITPFKKLVWGKLDDAGKQKLADRLETSVGYLKLIANGHRDPGHKLARKMRAETGVPLSKLRHDLWGKQP